MKPRHCCLLAVSLSLGANVARAETIEDRVRLGFDAALLQHATLNTLGSFQSLSVLDQADTTTTVTVSGPSFGAVVGYGVSEHFTIGARLAYSYARQSNATGMGSYKTEGFDGDVSCAYVFGDGALRPFLGPLFGYRSNAMEYVGSVSEHWFTIGARVGMHTFAAPAFSIDPSLMLGYATGSGETPSGSSTTPSTSYDIDGFVVGLHVALSGWIGGR